MKLPGHILCTTAFYNGLSFFDTTKIDNRTKDYLCIAYIRFDNLDLIWKVDVRSIDPRVASAIRDRREHLIKRVGEEYTVTSSGQKVILGTRYLIHNSKLMA